MEKKAVRYRYNALNINSLASFAGVKGGVNQNCKDVYFLRARAFAGDFAYEIQQMDAALLQSMAEEKLFYKKIEKLPPLADFDQIAPYAACYDKWAESGRREAQTKITAEEPELAQTLGLACRNAVELYKQSRSGANASMEKNFAVKLLYWFDQAFGGDAPARWSGKSAVKIVGMDVVKEQEYLFYYMLTQMGADALLLQRKRDFEGSEALLALSRAFTPQKLKRPAPAKEPAPVRQPEAKAAPEAGRDSAPARRPEERAALNAGRDSAAVRRPEKRAVPEAGRESVPVRPPEAKTGSGASRKPVSIRRSEVKRESNARQAPASVCPPERRAGASAFQRPWPSTQGESAPASPRREKSFEELAQLAASVVMIEVYDSRGEIRCTGSGIMIGVGGYILTNCHVAGGGSAYAVRIEEEARVYETDELVKYNPQLDLAIIRIGRVLKPIPIYQGKEPLVRGQKVVAIGSPLGLFNSVSDGIISGFRKIGDTDMIQFTAPISHGSSGGALLNMFGEIIGISTAGMDQGQNLNLAVRYEWIQTFARGFL